MISYANYKEKRSKRLDINENFIKFNVHNQNSKISHTTKLLAQNKLIK